MSVVESIGSPVFLNNFAAPTKAKPEMMIHIVKALMMILTIIQSGLSAVFALQFEIDIRKYS